MISRSCLESGLTSNNHSKSLNLQNAHQQNCIMADLNKVVVIKIVHQSNWVNDVLRLNGRCGPSSFCCQNHIDLHEERNRCIKQQITQPDLSALSWGVHTLWSSTLVWTDPPSPPEQNFIQNLAFHSSQYLKECERAGKWTLTRVKPFYMRQCLRICIQACES